jgi:hypothetical protein
VATHAMCCRRQYHPRVCSLPQIMQSRKQTTGMPTVGTHLVPCAPCRQGGPAPLVCAHHLRGEGAAAHHGAPAALAWARETHLHSKMLIQQQQIRRTLGGGGGKPSQDIRLDPNTAITNGWISPHGMV